MNHADLIDRYLPLVQRLAQGQRIIPDGAFDVDDLVQAGLLALCRAWDRYDATKGEFVPWASGQIVRAFLDVYRDMDPLSRIHRRRVKRGLLPPVRIRNCGHWPETMHPVDGGRSVESVVEDADECAFLGGNLDQRKQAVFRLRLLQELEQAEVGARVGVHPSYITRVEKEVREHARQRAAYLERRRGNRP